LPKVASQWNSGATRDSNRGRPVLIPSALTTRPPRHTNERNGINSLQIIAHQRIRGYVQRYALYKSTFYLRTFSYLLSYYNTNDRSKI